MQEKETLQQHIQNLRKEYKDTEHNNLFKNYHSQTSSQVRPPLFAHHQKHLLLFAYNRHKDQSSPKEIMLLEQPRKKIKEDQGNISYFESKQQKVNQQQQFFLQKVDPNEHTEIAQQIKQMLSISSQMATQDRLQRRKQIIQASKARKQKQLAHQQAMAKRIIRVVKLDSLVRGGSVKGVVELGGRQVQYEQLDFGHNTQDYYTLIKKKAHEANSCPKIAINEELLKPIDFHDEDDSMEEQVDSQIDSNAQNHPDNDYPDQDESDRSSQGIIEDMYDQGNERYYSDNQMQIQQEDQEEVYRRYLRRLNKKQRYGNIQPEYEYQEYD